jgi:hypothetical protein
MKTNELTGTALAWAVATCEGYEGAPEWVARQSTAATDWAEGGAIIERERIEIVPNDMWDAYKEGQHLPNTGATPLIAAMRCYVASKLGDEVQLPEEMK